MNDEDGTDDLSLTEILYALIPALIPFVMALIASLDREGRAKSPTARRLARNLGYLRVLAALFGAPKPTDATTPADPRSTRASTRAPTLAIARTSTRAKIRNQTPPAHPLIDWKHALRAAITPKPAQTLEL